MQRVRENGGGSLIKLLDSVENELFPDEELGEKNREDKKREC